MQCFTVTPLLCIRPLFVPQQFWDWLFRDKSTAKCGECGDFHQKATMFHNEYGWFCNEEEFKEYLTRTAPFQIRAIMLYVSFTRPFGR